MKTYWDESPIRRADEDGDRIGIEFLETIQESTHPELARQTQRSVVGRRPKRRIGKV